METDEKPIAFWFWIVAGVVCVIVGLVKLWSETKCVGCSPELFDHVDWKKRQNAGGWVVGGLICFFFSRLAIMLGRIKSEQEERKRMSGQD